MKKVRIAQIGISHEHAAGKMQDVFEIAGIVDDRAAIHTPIFHPADPDKFPGAHEFPFLTMEQVLADPTIEAVTIEVPNNEVVPTAMKCMERGLAMHMDKPAGEDLALYKKLLDGCEAKDLPFQVGYMFRNNPAMLFILKAARAGWLGGIMYNLGCHFIDYFVRLLGVPDKITSFLKAGPNSVNGGKNLALSVFEYPHAIATVRAFDREPNGGMRRRLRVGGTDGIIEFSPVERFDGKPIEVSMTLRNGNEEFAASTHNLTFGPVADRYEDQLLELARIVRGEIANPFTRKHDYDVHRVILAASGVIGWNKEA